MFRQFGRRASLDASRNGGARVRRTSLYEKIAKLQAEPAASTKRPTVINAGTLTCQFDSSDDDDDNYVNHASVTSILNTSDGPRRPSQRSLSPLAKRNSLKKVAKRLSFRTTKEAHVIMLDDQKVGEMKIMLKDTVRNIRKKVHKKLPFMENQDFWFAFGGENGKFVEFDKEAETQISGCIELGSGALFLYSESSVGNFNRKSGFVISEAALQSISGETEAVVRSCVRMIESISMGSFKKEVGVPSLIKVSLKFVRNAARASVEGRDLAYETLARISQSLRELEHVIRSISLRDNFEYLWNYRNDKKTIKNIVSDIQQQLHLSSLIREDHPAYLVRFKQADPQTEAILRTLGQGTVEDLLNSKYGPTRRKVAALVGMRDEDLVLYIEGTKTGHRTKGESDKALFRDRGSLIIRSHSLQGDLEAQGLQGILAPFFNDHKSIMESQVWHFHDDTRKWAIDAYDQWLSGEQNQQCFIFTGISGSGKTAFCSKIVESRRDTVLGYHFCRHDDDRYRSAKNMLLSLAYQLTVESPHYERRVKNLLIRYSLSRKKLMSEKCSISMIFTEMFENLLQEIPVPQNERYCLIIDGIDEANDGESGKNEIVDVIREYFLRLPPWMGIVITTRTKSNLLKRLRVFNALVVQPRPEHDHDDLMTYFKDILDQNDYSNDDERQLLADSLRQNAAGSFLFARIIADKIDQLIDDDDGLLNEYFSCNLERILEKEFSILSGEFSGMFLNIVKLAMVAISPLSKGAIVDLSSSPEKDLNVLLSKASTFFVVVGEKVRFVHKRIKNWLLGQIAKSSSAKPTRQPRRGSYGGTSIRSVSVAGVSDEIKKCHEYFASRVVSLLAPCGSGVERFRCDSESTLKYLLSYGVHHLVFAGWKPYARRLILNPCWLVAKANDATGIVECCELLAASDDLLLLLGRAVSLSLNSIQEDPRQLMGQIVGRLIAVTEKGHGDPSVREQIAQFLDDIRSYNYGYQWWCPVAPTWDQAEQAFQRRLGGHENVVQGVAWHSDARRCASSSWDKTIRIFDSVTGYCESLLVGHSDSVWCLDWDPTSDRLVSGGLDRTVRIWNTETEECEWVLRGHLDSVWCVKWSNDATQIASGSKDKTIRVWNGEDGVLLRILDGHQGQVYGVAWENNGNGRLCSGATDNTVRVWDVADESCLSVFTGHHDWVRSVHWCVTGKVILSASADKTIRMWDVGTGTCEQVLMGHSEGVWSIAGSKDGAFAISGSTDGTVRVWDCLTGACDQVLEGHSNAVWDACICPKGKRALSCSSDKSVVVWDITVERSTKRIEGHSRPIWGVDISNDGETVVTASSDKTGRVWNARSGSCDRVFTGHSGPVWAAKLSNDGKRVATASTDNTAAIYRTNSGERVTLLVGHKDSVFDVAWSIDDKFLYTASRDTTVRRWDTKTGNVVATFEGHTAEVKCLSASPNGELLASGSRDSSIRIWDLASDECTQVFQREDSPALCVAFGPDSKRVLAGYQSGSVCLWSIKTGERETCFSPGHTRRTNAVSWSPDGSRVASAGNDREIRIWKLDGSCERVIRGSTSLGVFGLAWGDNKIVSSGFNNSIKVWEASSGKCKSVFAGHLGLGIYDVSWSKDGEHVVAGSRDRTVLIFNTRTGRCNKVLRGHTNWVYSVDWEAGGERVLSWSDDETTRIWNVATGECEQVLDGCQSPNDFRIEKGESKTVNLSLPGGDSSPVGVQCDKAVVHGDRACGWIGNSIYFFRLLGGENGENGDCTVSRYQEAKTNLQHDDTH